MSIPEENPTDQDAWWIDYLEGELTERGEAAVRVLLDHSGTDRLIVENFRFLRWLIAQTDRVDVPVSESYYQDLQGKIMNQVGHRPVFEPECDDRWTVGPRVL